MVRAMPPPDSQQTRQRRAKYVFLYWCIRLLTKLVPTTVGKYSETHAEPSVASSLCAQVLLASARVQDYPAAGWDWDPAFIDTHNATGVHPIPASQFSLAL